MADAEQEQLLKSAYDQIRNDRSSAVQAYVFTSFDLVNSTAYKQRDRTQWPDVTKKFYLSTVRHFEDRRQPGSRLRPTVWKYVGDEVLFYIEVFNLNEVAEAVRLSQAVVSELQKTETEKPATMPQARASQLGVKGTCWVALVSDGSEAENLVVRPNGVPGRDFLGPDIDTGFRISKKAIRGGLVVSPELVILLHEANREDTLPIRQVGFDKFRGIWNQRPYPILWYRNNWGTFESDFDYDEFLESPELTAGNSVANLCKVEEIRRMILQTSPSGVDQLISHLKTGERPDEYNDAQTKDVDIHVVAVCLSEDMKSVMMRKRNDDGIHAKNTWDFGCTTLVANVKIRDCLRDGYRTKYGLNIDPYPSNEVAPLSDFVFQKGDSLVNGVVVLAKTESLEVEKKGTDYLNRSIEWVALEDGPHEPSVPDAKAIFQRVREFCATRSQG